MKKLLLFCIITLGAAQDRARKLTDAELQQFRAINAELNLLQIKQDELRTEHNNLIRDICESIGVKDLNQCNIDKGLVTFKSIPTPPPTTNK